MSVCQLHYYYIALVFHGGPPWRNYAQGTQMASSLPHKINPKYPKQLQLAIQQQMKKAKTNNSVVGGGLEGNRSVKRRGEKRSSWGKGKGDWKLEGLAERLSEWFEMCPMQSFVMNYCSIELSLYSWLGLKQIWKKKNPVNAAST